MARSRPPATTTVASTRLLVAALCHAVVCASFADAVVAKPGNGSSVAAAGPGAAGPRRPLPDRLETSQTRVNQVQDDDDDDGRRLYDRPAASANRVSGKDYDGGAGGFHVKNTYGPPPPPRDYYYDERPDYYRPHQTGGDDHYFHGGPPEAIYHQHPPPPPPHQQYQHASSASAGGHGGPGQLDIQPLLWPLAGITLLGVLSALVKAPLLLHLGTVGHRRRRRRRRSSAPQPEDPTTAAAVKSLLDKFNYEESTRFNAKPCLVCDVVASIYNEKSSCVERSVCKVMSQNEPDGVKMDKRFLTTMIAQVVENDQIPKEFKKRLESAETSGRSGGNCERLYPCHSGSADGDSGVAPGTVLK